MATITRAEIIDSIRDRLEYTRPESSRRESTRIFKTLLEIIKGTLESGEDVLISGFGKFCVKDKGERKGWNPATGDDLMLPARRVVVFKCSGLLRDRMNVR